MATRGQADESAGAAAVCSAGAAGSSRNAAAGVRVTLAAGWSQGGWLRTLVLHHHMSLRQQRTQLVIMCGHGAAVTLLDVSWLT